MTPPRSPRAHRPAARSGPTQPPAIYFRCRMCGSAAVVTRNGRRVIRCTACGFTEPAATRA